MCVAVSVWMTIRAYIGRAGKVRLADDAVMKHFGRWKGSDDVKSSVSLNWLLDDECEIVKVEE